MTDAHMSTNRLQFSDDPELDLQFMRALAGAPYGGASPGEVLHVARTIERRGGDRDAYIAAWAEHGARAAGQAQEALASGRRATARGAFLRAYNSLRAAEFYFPAARLEERRELYERGLAQFDAATELMPHPAEKLEIPYRPGVTLPGYMFKPDSDPRPRPTVVVCGGLDGAGEELYFLGGVPDALARGLNVIVFHGPGQRGLQLRDPEQAFRPDAEVPISAVLDHAVARPDVDGDRVALYGLSFGGYLAPRAAAHDRRVRALVANAPITDLLDLLVQTIGAVPDSRVADLLRSAPWPAAANVENYLLWHHGVETLDDFAEHAAQFTLAGLVDEIACPTLCVAAEGESPGAAAQARQFFDALRAPKEFAELLVTDGADTHCGISNVPYTSALVYDWIVETLGGPAARPSTVDDRTTAIGSGGRRDRAEDLAAIEAVVERLEHAQQTEQVDDFIGLFRPDATWVTAHGRRLIGRDDIGEFTRAVLPGAMRTSTATYAVDHVTLVRPDVAVVSVRQRPVDLDFRPLDDQPEGRPTYVLTRDAGRWRIAAGQNTQVKTDG